MESKLSSGIIPKLFNKAADGVKFIAQVSSLKKLDNPPNAIRLKLSDGTFENQYVMYEGPKLESLKQYAIIQAENWNVPDHSGSGKVILTIKSAKILHDGDEVKRKLGTPKPWKLGDAMPKGGNAPVRQVNPGKENAKPASGRYVAIQTLTPYMNKWTIKGRVTSKDSQMRSWNNAKGQGCLFGFTIIDETSDLKVTAFKEDAEKYFPIIEKGKIYQITNGQLKAKNPRFNNTQHDYELTIGKLTTIEEVHGDDDVPTQVYDFKKLDQLELFDFKRDDQNRAVRKIVDIVAIVQTAGELSSILIKSQGKDLEKRELTLVDDSERSVSCTLWGKEAVEFDENNIGTVVALKGASLSDYGGRSLSVGQQTDVTWNIKGNDEADQLKEWWANKGSSVSFTGMSQGSGGSSGARTESWKMLKQVNVPTVQAVPDSKPMYFTTKATVTYIGKDNAVYKGCKQKLGDRNCQKKVLDEGNGNFRCEKCDISSNEFEYRMILKASIADDSGSHFLTFFQQQGEQMLNMNVQDFGELFDNREVEDTRYDAVMTAPLFKEMILNCRATVDNWQDEQRVRISANRVADINYAQHAERLIEELAQYS